MDEELTQLQRAEHLAERKRLYVQAHPETKHGGAPGAGRGKAPKDPESGSLGRAPSFVDDTAEKTGICRTVIAESIKRAENIDKSVKDIIANLPTSTWRRGRICTSRRTQPPNTDTILSRATKRANSPEIPTWNLWIEPPSFVEDAVAKTGMSERVVHRAIERSESISPTERLSMPMARAMM